MSEYLPPEYRSDGFNCPYCNAYAKQTWAVLGGSKRSWLALVVDTDSGYVIDDWDVIYIDEEPVYVSLCARCENATLWLDEKIIYPTARMGPPVNSDLPDNVKEIYEEASAIAGLSARAACALLRLAIEMLLKDLGFLKEKRNINDSIGELVRAGVDKRVQQALDVVRVTGNNAVHPGTIDFDDSTDVSSLFELINYIADTLITRPNKASEMFDNLPEGAKRGIKRRDSKT